ncbi:MAG: PilZ domain-containing protein [Polyangiaceae bacterium]|jgi:hypothetical protein|nr:PilZ domain-containing protein [Polyangiaceae bacterium]MBK8939366.1 PilZ domain-containing protein [Polyangiaceae bacterium]
MSLSMQPVQERITPPPPSPILAERRAHRRAALDRPVLLETASKTATGRLLNVSGGGLALRSELDLAVAERVSVYFELPIGFGVQADAEVLRREGAITVVRFVDAPSQAVLAIRSFCRISGLMPAYTGPKSR